MSWFDRLKQARNQTNLTQTELGTLIGVAKSTVAGYEKGSSQPDVAKLSAIMDVLNIDANFLFQDEMQLNCDSTDVQLDVLTNRYKSLNPDGKQKLLDYADDLVSSGKYIKTKTDENCG